MPSTLKHPSYVPIWRGVKSAYLIIAMCLFPIAIGGFWAYGHLIPANGILTALYQFHGNDTSRAALGFTFLLVVINCLSSFQIYAMPVFDNMEAGYTSKHNKPCPWWLRSGLRAFFGAVSFFIAISVSVNRHGNICGLTKRGGAGIDPSVILDMVSVAKHVSQQLISVLDSEIFAAESAADS